MKKLYVKKGIEILAFFIFFIIFQIIQFTKMFDFPFAQYFFLDCFLILIIASVIFIVRNTLFDQIYLSIVMFAIALFCAANGIFYSNFGDVFSLYNLGLINQGVQVAANPSFFDFGFLSIVILTYAFFVVFVVLFNRFYKITDFKSLFKTSPLRKETSKFEIKRRYFSFLSSVVVLVGSFSISDNFVSDNRVVITMQKSANFKKYGTLTYYLKELNYLVNGSNNIDESDLIKYFTQTESVDNNYTGLLKDMNVFVIMVETGDSLMLNPTLTPNITSLTETGLYCSNNHSKNKTNISEFIGITGSAPSMGIQADKYDYYLPYSLPNMLGDRYTKMYFHDVGKVGLNDRDIYSRHVLMPKLNFDRSYFHEDLYPADTPIWGWQGDYSLDSETLDTVSDIVLEQDEPFFAFYTSLTMHGPYKDPINEPLLRSLYGSRLDQAKRDGSYVNPLAGTENEECIDNFMLASMDFDNALGDLFDKFEKAGKLDDTLFVIYGDHDIYYPGADGVGLNLTLAGVDNIVYCPFDTTLFFYNKKLTERFKQNYGTTEYEQFTSPYNIVPTVLDLLGIDYNPNFYMSSSLFSEEMEKQQVFYSSELSAVFNDWYYSTDGSMINYVFDENAKQKVDFLNAASRALEKQNYLEKILTSDYFSIHDFESFNQDANIK